MKILFRTDSSYFIGSGHAFRCLTLADNLRQRGAEVIFVCREFQGNMIGVIEGKGYKAVRLPYSVEPPACTAADAGYAGWLGGRGSPLVRLRTDRVRAKSGHWPSDAPFTLLRI